MSDKTYNGWTDYQQNGGGMRSSLKELEASLYWQQVVLTQSKDAKQKERVMAAIERLQKELANHNQAEA